LEELLCGNPEFMDGCVITFNACISSSFHFRGLMRHNIIGSQRGYILFSKIIPIAGGLHFGALCKMLAFWSTIQVDLLIIVNLYLFIEPTL
jgi:hypothetical protein